MVTSSSFNTWDSLFNNLESNGYYIPDLLEEQLKGTITNVSNIFVDRINNNIIRLNYQQLTDSYTLDFGDILPNTPIVEDFEFLAPEIFFAKTQEAFRYTPVDADGDITIYRGINFITNMKLGEVDNEVIELVTDVLGNPDIIVQLFIDPDGFITLNGTYQDSLNLIDWGNFEVTYADPQLEFSTGVTSSPSLAVKASLILNGYDPFQDNEPELKLTGTLGVDLNDITSVSIAGNLDLTQSGSVWQDPFGLAGVEINRLAVQLNYDSAGVVTGFGFSGTFRFDGWDIDTDILLDADPRNWNQNAILLTVNQPLSLVDIWAGPISLALSNSVGNFVDLSLVSSALDFLDKIIDLEISSFDSDGDGEIDPLIYFVPFPTTIGTKVLEAGFEINGKISAWGEEGFLAVNVNKQTRSLTASLELPEIDWGILRITGVNDPTLDLALKASSSEVYLQGNGQLEIFGQEIAKADFKISNSAIEIRDLDLSFFGVINLDIDDLYVGLDYQDFTARATAKLGILGLNIADASLDYSDGRLKIDASANVDTGIFGNFGVNLGLSIGTSISDFAMDIGFTAFGADVNLSVDLSFLEDNTSLSDIIIDYLSDFLPPMPDYLAEAVNDALDWRTLGGLNVTLASSTWDAIKQYFSDLFTSDPVEFIGGNGNDSQNGNDNSDVLIGNGGNDWLHGRLRSDLLDGGSGNDTLFGGNDEDTIFGGDGNDEIYGQNHNDELYGWNGNDYINGDGDAADNGRNGGNDTIYGGQGDDTLYDGGQGNDTLYGDSGNDRLDGGQGNDILSGGSENDTIVSGVGIDTIDGGEGIDTLELSSVNFPFYFYFVDLEQKIVDYRYLDSSLKPRSSGLDIDNIINIENIIGNQGNDQILGDNQDNILSGVQGNDKLVGRGGDDTLYGDTDNDTLEGGDGNDELQGWTGNDRLEGGVGNDTVNGGENNDTIYGDNGNDLLAGWTGNDFLRGGDGIDTIYGGDGNDWVDYWDSSIAWNIDLFSSNFQRATAGNITESLYSIENIQGGGGNDTLRGNNDPNFIWGMEGSDVIRGEGGNDSLAGNQGNDTIYGGVGNDSITAGSGNHVFYGEWGNDFLQGGNGNDRLDGGLGNDHLIAFDGDDFLDGGNENDLLEGGNGADTLRGGTGDDTFYGGNGFDIVDYRYSSSGFNISLLNPLAGEPLYSIEGIEGASGNDTLRGDSQDNYLSGNNGQDVLDGDRGNDTLEGGIGNDSLNGGLGNDTIHGGDGNDTINGGDSNDTINGGAGDDSLDGFWGNDTLDGGDGNDNLVGGDGNDNLVGGAGNDTLDGGSGSDTINGGAGNDTLDGGDFSDTINGGEGDDTINGGNGYDIISGGDGNDRLDGGFLDDTLEGGDGNDTLDGGSGSDSINGGQGSDSINGGEGNDTLDGGEGDDTINGGGGNDTLRLVGNRRDYNVEINVDLSKIYILITGKNQTKQVIDVENIQFADRTYSLNEITPGVIIGTEQSDNLSGAVNNKSNEYIDGRGGNDTLLGYQGDDTLEGGDGKDSLDGGYGNDSLDGGLGNDSLNGSEGNDLLDAGDGDDTLYGDDSNDVNYGRFGFSWNDTLYGGEGNDYLFGSYGNDTVDGGNGNDTLGGGADDDSLEGSDGNDSLGGGDGNDSLGGGDGNDSLRGGNGNDTVNGGNGNDWLLGENGKDTVNGGNGDDIISGDDGDDIISGGYGNDTLGGWFGHDIISGGYGDDRLEGGDGDDNLQGGEGNDTLYGNEGSNSLFASEGNDELYGGNSNDTLGGSLGNDTLDGSLGTDTMILNGKKSEYTFNDIIVTGPDGIDVFRNIEKIQFLDIDGTNNTYNYVNGTVIDGFIQGGTVFLDANLNGIHDRGEVSTLSNQNGQFQLLIDEQTFNQTDRNNNGIIDISEGRLAMIGGIDSGSELPFEGILTAPADSPVITPFTSLVERIARKQSITAEEAQSLIVDKWFISSSYYVTFSMTAEVTEEFFDEAGNLIGIVTYPGNPLITDEEAIFNISAESLLAPPSIGINPETGEYDGIIYPQNLDEPSKEYLIGAQIQLVSEQLAAFTGKPINEIIEAIADQFIESNFVRFDRMSRNVDELIAEVAPDLHDNLQLAVKFAVESAVATLNEEAVDEGFESNTYNIYDKVFQVNAKLVHITQELQDILREIANGAQNMTVEEFNNTFSPLALGDRFRNSTYLADNIFPAQSEDFTVTLDDHSTYTFGLNDFPFIKGDENDTLNSVIIEVPSNRGTLKLGNKTITKSTEISAQDIKAGLLTFTPESNAFGDNYAQIGFYVTDGKFYSDNLHFATINLAEDDTSTPNIIEGTPGADVLTGTAFDDVIIGRQRGDILRGNGGNDEFVYNSLSDAGDFIADFESGDKINLVNLLESINYQGIDPISDGVVSFRENGNNTAITVNNIPLAIVQNMSSAIMNNSDHFILI